MHLIVDLKSDMKLSSTIDGVYGSLNSSSTRLLIVHGCARQLNALELTSLFRILRYVFDSLVKSSTSFRSLLKYCQGPPHPLYLKLQLPVSPSSTFLHPPISYFISVLCIDLCLI